MGEAGGEVRATREAQPEVVHKQLALAKHLQVQLCLDILIGSIVQFALQSITMLKLIQYLGATWFY
jgi:hypothetical protein